MEQKIKFKRKRTDRKLQNFAENYPALNGLSVLMDRLSLAKLVGTQTYDGNRDIYQALGYPTKLGFMDFFKRYLRQDMAKAIIDRPVSLTWQGNFEIVEADKANETKLEKDWKTLYNEFGIKSIFSRADKLTGIGKYGIILLGFNDVSNVDDFSKKVEPSKTRKLIYIKPLSQHSARIKKINSDPTNKRFGKPELYEIDLTGDIDSTQKSFVVHYSRIIHIVDDILENENEGIPRLQAVFNRLLDLEKVVGGSGEMYWRGARPGYAGTVKEGYTFGTKEEEALQTQLDEFEHNLRRILMNEGVDFKSLAQQISDPKGHVDVIVSMMAAVTGFPKRILMGSEIGSLASTQDKNEVTQFIQNRRDDYAEIRIVRPFINRLLELKVLPSTINNDMKYGLKWPPIFEASAKEKAEVGKSKSESIKNYFANPQTETQFPFDLFLDIILGLSQDEIDLIAKTRQFVSGNELPISPEEQAIIDQQNA